MTNWRPTIQTSLLPRGSWLATTNLFNRTSWLDNTIEHTSKAFLGLTTNCAKWPRPQIRSDHER